MSAPDIRRPEAIDAAWLTRALQASRVDAVVSDFTAAPRLGPLSHFAHFN